MFCLVGYKAMLSVESQLTFQGDMSIPSSGLKSKHERDQHKADSKLCFMLLSHLAYTSTLKMEAAYSSETFTQLYIPENGILQPLLRETQILHIITLSKKLKIDHS
jgi:hypothetical protein